MTGMFVGSPHFRVGPTNDPCDSFRITSACCFNVFSTESSIRCLDDCFALVARSEPPDDWAWLDAGVPAARRRYPAQGGMWHESLPRRYGQARALHVSRELSHWTVTASELIT